LFATARPPDLDLWRTCDVANLIIKLLLLPLEPHRHGKKNWEYSPIATSVEAPEIATVT
jgi:hypothetical protein